MEQKYKLALLALLIILLLCLLKSHTYIKGFFAYFSTSQSSLKCIPAENNSVLCSNGLDDDCDGLIDSQDPDCAVTVTLKAIERGHDITILGDEMIGYIGSECVGIESEKSVYHCSNNEDDDCDGLVDCEDPDCLNANPENNIYKCRNKIDDDCDTLIDAADPGCR
jgi:hypothetical protein